MIPLYPLRFDPIYQYRLWGGRRLGHLLSAPLPGERPIGEAWLLSDRDAHPSIVAAGPLEGNSLRHLLLLLHLTGSPPPVTNLRHILAELIDVAFMLHEFVQ